ncbi:uncharacterized protein LOC129571067 [Sitodiplosis mosellana]|uniref:uncharacterized protein LOC129571067 n=1 Tax=Sitodiplosis mosellana TaxID=263140 RepID=UPI00244497FB|nr:uncharacterized protein LOC129571067 [Sitodiplosis mosellana]
MRAKFFRLDQFENNWGEFDGNVEKWQGFHDRFKSAVHDNELITPAFKIMHLLKSLKGKAKADLGEWPQTEAGYYELWERMQELYAQKYYTARKLLNRFLALPVLERASHNALQKMSNVTHEVIRQLRTLNYPVQYYDLFFVAGIHTRLDSDSSKAWELERTSDTPTIIQMLSFLDRQARAAPSSSSYEQKKQNDNRKRGYFETKPETSSDAKRSKPNGANENKTDRTCKVYKGAHAVHKCETFKKLSLTERRKSAKENELCFNCLNPSHTRKDCKLSGCRRCENKKHWINSVQVRNNSKKKSNQPKAEGQSS